VTLREGSSSPAPDGETPETDQPPVPTDRISSKLSEEDLRMVDQLRSRDQEVRQHEAAHQAVGGSLAGAASFTYQVGPDRKAYAVGGEVPIAMREGRTPDETISNARQVRAAALAPAKPSGQDLQVAAAATQMELMAVQQKQQLAEAARTAEVAAERTTEQQSAQRTTETRGTHLHSGEPCATCAKDAASYI
jgi:hypothetical protein